MFICEIGIIGYKIFETRNFDFPPGMAVIPLGSRDGRSSFTEVLKILFLPLSQEKLASGTTFGMSKTSLRMKIQLNGHAVTLMKDWDSGAVTQWSASINGIRTYNLQNSHDLKAWMSFFLNETAPTMIARDDETRVHEDILFPLYTLIISMAVESSSLLPGWLSDPVFWNQLSGNQAAVSLISRLKTLQPFAKAHDEDQRRSWSQDVLINKQADDIRQELDALTVQIRNQQQNQGQLEKSLEKLRSELKQQEHIRVFIDEKQSEREKAGFEISTFESLLNESFIGLSEEEFRSLEQKKRRYDELEHRVTDLEGKLIERQHLEKNLMGLRTELDTLKADLSGNQSGTETLPGAKQIRDFESEITRIQDHLRKLAGTEFELQAACDELKVYLQDHHQYEVLLKAKEWMTRNDRKKIKSSLTRARKQKQETEEEIVSLEKHFIREKADALRKEIAAKEQTIAQVQLSFYDLTERMKKMNAQLQELNVPGENQFHAPVMSVSRYFKIFESIYEKKAELASRKAREGFLNFVQRQLSLFYNDPESDQLTKRISPQWMSQHPENIFSFEPGLSGSEKRFFGIVLRILLIRHFTKLDWILFDEPSDSQLTNHELDRLSEHCSAMGFEQILFFRIS